MADSTSGSYLLVSVVFISFFYILQNFVKGTNYFFKLCALKLKKLLYLFHNLLTIKQLHLTPMKHELIQTSDGSTSLYIADLQETYHSKHGALQENPARVYTKRIATISAASSQHTGNRVWHRTQRPCYLLKTH